MTAAVALLRGINVGGRNLIAMSDLVTAFREAGYPDATTYSQSGNVLFTITNAGDHDVEQGIQQMLAARFGLPILVVVRSRDELADTVAAAPSGHGAAKLRSEVFFLKHPLTPEAVLRNLPALREGVDSVAPGPGVIYFSRIAARGSKTRITRLMAMPIFQQMTVRSWSTTTRILERLDAGEPDQV